MEDSKLTKKPENVILKKEEYEAIINNLQTLTSKVSQLQNQGIFDPDEEKQHTAFVRTYEDKVVLELKDVKPVGDDVFGKIFATLVLEDGRSEKVDYLDFLRNAPRVQVKILETTVFDKGVRVLGAVPAAEVKEYRTVTSDVMVPLKVTTPVYTAKVEFTDGKQLTMKVSSLNI